MNKLLILDDDRCKSELDAFIKAHRESVKLLVEVDEVSLKIDQLLDNISSIYRIQNLFDRN